MSYTEWSVVYGEQPTAAKWNQLGSNDAGFRDGTNIDDDVILARHTEELPKCIDVQDESSDEEVTDQIIQRGWGYILGTASSSIVKAIIFPTEFDDNEIDISVVSLGVKTTAGAPTTRNGGNSSAANLFEVSSNTIETTGFTIRSYNRDAVNHVAGYYYVFSWIAIGKKAR